MHIFYAFFPDCICTIAIFFTNWKVREWKQILKSSLRTKMSFYVNRGISINFKCFLVFNLKSRSNVEILKRPREKIVQSFQVITLFISSNRCIRCQMHLIFKLNIKWTSCTLSFLKITTKLNQVYLLTQGPILPCINTELSCYAKNRLNKNHQKANLTRTKNRGP